MERVDATAVASWGCFLFAKGAPGWSRGHAGGV